MKNQNKILDIKDYSNRQENRIKPSCKLAEFLGWHVGDGCISITKGHYQYTLTGDIVEEYPFYKEIIVPSFNTIFADVLKKPVILKKYRSVGVCGIYLFDRSFLAKLQRNFDLKSGKKTNVQVPSLLKTTNQKKHFIRGVFDTDGSIYFCKSNFKRRKKSLYNLFHYSPKIKLATISGILIEQVHNMLCSLGFSPRIQKPIRQRKHENIVHSVVMDTKKDTLKWFEEISFRNIKHLTKVKVRKKFGFCPPYTTLQQRFNILNGNLNPLTFYQGLDRLSLTYIKKSLS